MNVKLEFMWPIIYIRSNHFSTFTKDVNQYTKYIFRYYSSIYLSPGWVGE